MHLESPEHVIAVFLLGKANGPSDRILLHFAAEKPRELPTVAEVKIFTKGIKKCLVHDRIVAGSQSIVDMHGEDNFRFLASGVPLPLDVGDSIIVEIGKSVGLEPAREKLVPARGTLAKAIHIGSTFEAFTWREPVPAREVEIDIFFARGHEERAFDVKLVKLETFLSSKSTNGPNAAEFGGGGKSFTESAWHLLATVDVASSAIFKYVALTVIFGFEREAAFHDFVIVWGVDDVEGTHVEEFCNFDITCSIPTVGIGPLADFIEMSRLWSEAGILYVLSIADHRGAHHGQQRCLCGGGMLDAPEAIISATGKARDCTCELAYRGGGGSGNAGGRSKHLIKSLGVCVMIFFESCPEMPGTEHGIVKLGFSWLVLIGGVRMEQSDLIAMSTTRALVGMMFHDLDGPAYLVGRPKTLGALNMRFHANEAFGKFIIAEVFNELVAMTTPGIGLHDGAIRAGGAMCKYRLLKVAQVSSSN